MPLNILSKVIRSAYLTLTLFILVSESVRKTKNYWPVQLGFRVKNPKAQLAFKIFLNCLNS